MRSLHGLNKLRSIHVLQWFLVIGHLFPQMESAFGATRPNVLFIMADDLNADMDCYPGGKAQTPHLDRLAARGVRFDRAYCQFPLCGPSRNSMLCGLYPNATGILRNSQIFRQTIPSHHSLPQAFRLEGYVTARVGKLYHYNVPKSVGTNGHDDPASWEIETNPAGCDRLEEEPFIFSLKPGQFGGTLSWYASPQPDEKHTDGMLAEDAIWLLERFAKRPDRPFFLALGFYRPHTPYVAPKFYFGAYPTASIRLVEGVQEDIQDLPAMALGSHKAEHDLLTDPLRREAIQAYRASVSFMDAQVGRVLQALERLGLSEETIVVFTSDHGYHLGEHGLWQKMSLFEESARVPLIMAGPGVSAHGEVVPAPVGLVDLYPTLTALCGVQAPADLQGQNLALMLKNPQAKGRGYALTQVTRTRKGLQPNRVMGYSLRTERWRLTLWDDQREGVELYDHSVDPAEQHNLAGEAMWKDLQDELMHKLRTAVRQTLPATGSVPTLRQPIWPPNLTHP